jgi:hypothetical protein
MELPLLAKAPVTLPAGKAEAVQENVVPEVVLVRLMPVVPAEQIVCPVGVAITFGVGFTVTTT